MMSSRIKYIVLLVICFISVHNVYAGGNGNTYYAKVTAKLIPTGAGTVYVNTNNTSNEGEESTGGNYTNNKNNLSVSVNIKAENKVGYDFYKWSFTGTNTGTINASGSAATTIKVNASSSSGQNNAKAYTVQAEFVKILTDGTYVLYSNNNYLTNNNGSIASVTEFNPETCLWTASSGKLSNGGYYLESSNLGALSIASGGSTIWYVDDTNSSIVFCAKGTNDDKSKYYLNYNNGWLAEKTATTSEVAYPVTTETIAASGTNDVKLTANPETLSWARGNGSSQSSLSNNINSLQNWTPAYTIYKFGGNNHRFYYGKDHGDTEPTAINHWSGLSCEWTVEDDGADYASVSGNLYSAQVVYKREAPQANTCARIRFSIIYNNEVVFSTTTDIMLDPGTYTDQVASPVLTFDHDTKLVTISCETEGATLYYTTDNSDPTSSSTEYTNLISITSATTIKVIGTKNNFVNSAISYLKIYSITDVSSNGTVTPSYSLATKEKEITLTASPATDYLFNNVSGNWIVSDGATNQSITIGENNTCTFTMPGGNVTVRAIFKEKECTITTVAEPATGGTITGGGDFAKGKSTTLTATANPGYTFTKWHDDVTDNPRTIENIQADATYTAIFTATKYKVQKVVAANGGDFTISGTEQEGGNDVAGTGTVLTLTATPDSGYDLGSWKIMDSNDADITSTVGLTLNAQDGNKATFNMPAKDVKVTATFTLHKYKINLIQPAEGTISSDPATSAEKDTEVTLSYTANAGYEFQSWTVVSGGITITDNKFTMPASDVTISATYVAKTYNITVNATGGTVTADPTSGKAGDVITLTATPDAKNSLYSIKGERDDNHEEFQISKSGTNYSFTMPTSNVTITAEFKAYQTGPCEDDPTMTWIASLNDIKDANGRYRLAIEIDNPSDNPGVTEFGGTLDGYFHTISGRTSALFDKLNGGTVKNVTLDNVNISGTGNVGAIANEATNSRIYNCSVLATGSKADQMEDDKRFTSSSSVSGTNYVGGILGLLSGSTSVVNCVSYADVSGGAWNGGIVGYADTEVGNSSYYSIPCSTLDGWSIGNHNGNFQVNTWSSEGNSDGSSMTTPFIEYWIASGSTLQSSQIRYQTITGLSSGTYTITAQVRMYNERGTSTPSGAYLFANGGSDKTQQITGTSRTYNNKALVYATLSMDVNVNATGSLTFGFNINNASNLNWFAFKNITITKKGGEIRFKSVVNCMALGEVKGTDRSPIVGGTNPISNNSIYSYFRYKSYSNVDGLTQNGALAIQEDIWLKRFEFFRAGVNNHRDMAAYYCLGDVTQKSEMAIWVIDPEVSPWPILNKAGARKSTLERTIPTTYQANEGNLITNAPEDVKKRYNMSVGSNGYLTVNLTINDKTYSNVKLPITDMDYSRYDYTWGKVVLPHANEFEDWTHDYSKVCIGWEITSMDASGENEFSDYNFADRDCTNKDLYSKSGYIYAQGGNFIVPYRVTTINIKAHFAQAYYLSDANYDCSANGGNPIGGTRPTTYHGQTVYTSVADAWNAMTNYTNARSPHEKAIVLVGNYHYTSNTSGTYTGKGCTIMSVDDDGDQIPDYGWYSSVGDYRQSWPSIRWDFLPIVGAGMLQSYDGMPPGLGIPVATGWWEMTETTLCRTFEFEISDNYRNSADDGKGNNCYILNGGWFQQLVRCWDGECKQLSYLKVGGNAYIKELFMGNHSSQSHAWTIRPVNVTGGEIPSCFMTGMGNKKVITATDNNVRFYCAGGKIGKYLSIYMEYPVVNATMKVDHAYIDRFFGGGTTSKAELSGDIDITMNYSDVNFFCGGPEFGDMTSGKKVTVNTTGSTFGQYYGAGFGGTALTRKLNDETYSSMSTINNYSSQYLQSPSGAGGVGVSYEMEALLDGAGNALYRFYDYYAALSMATTGNVSTTAKDCLFKESFYGGGCQGKVNGTITSSLTNCDVRESVFGGGYKAAATTIDVYPTTAPTYPGFNSTYKAFSNMAYPNSTPYTWIAGTSTGTVSGTTIQSGLTAEQMATLGQVTGAITLTIDGGSVGGNVFGGGNESQSKSDATVTIKGDATVVNNVFGGGNLANVTGATKVNINGGTLNTKANTAVYGGGALANVGGDTQVNLNGGSVGSVYGGGLGRLASDTETAIAATVGSATINIGSGTPDNSASGGATDVAGSCQITGSVFGCNNLNGTPTGNATVNVFKTYNATPDSTNSYNSKIEAVYGGGNLAAYLPTANTSTAKVTVYTCYNAIDYVYGGGNAASTPATSVTIWGGKMKNVFGGGNGAGEGNPGADVGYKDFTWDNEHAYGAGTTTVNIWGGVIENVFGGSNTRGNIRVSSNVNLDDKEACEFQIGGVYGAGNEAAMYGNGNLVIGCIPGMTEIYGGSKAADINGDVSLTITNGTFGKVFGGNNLGGKLNGSITVNIEETGCKPVIIGELYGCGNQAPYSVYGYEEALDANGKVVVKVSGTKLHADPVVNIYSCTSIGSVFGGGYGAGAVVVGSPTVNINQVKGTPNGVESSTLGTIGTIFGGGNAARVIGDTNVNIGTLKKYTVLSGTDKGQEKTIVGANITGNVYGGGNEAEVTGKTNVVIGADK